MQGNNFIRAFIMSTVATVTFFFILKRFKHKKLLSTTSSSLLFPIQRKFIDLGNASAKDTPKPIISAAARVTTVTNLRVLQFNILADGLYGLRPDKGDFARLSSDAKETEWTQRHPQLLHEILQYDPDVVNIQELDHYDDWLCPEMSARGYICLYTPKPASACLHVSSRPDGCAVFLKESKLTLVSSQSITYTQEGKIQNQVGIIATVKIQPQNSKWGQQTRDQDDRYLILATTHLKAEKSLIGEQSRAVEGVQLLDRISQVKHDLLAKGHTCSGVIVTGDMNAAPIATADYSPMCYTAMKQHLLGLQSVYNDDLPPKLQRNTLIDQDSYGWEKEGMYTTWKARKMRGEASEGQEKISRQCIDYIFYASDTLRPRAVLDVFTHEQLGDALLPSAIYPSDHLAIAADFDILRN